MNTEIAGFALNMDFSQLGVAGVVCALLFGGLVYAVNHFKSIIKDMKDELKAKDLIIANKDVEYKQVIKEYNEDLREMELSAITTINKFIEVQHKIYENTRRSQG